MGWHYFILACTDVIRKVCSCVHAYTKATYDVHAVFSVHVCIYIWCTRHFSVHVCHSFKYRIIWSLLMIVYFPLYFQVFLFGVYKQYTQLMSITIAWNFTGIWHTGTCCSDIRHFTKYISGIYSILWKFQHVTGLISYGWYSEVYSSAFHYCIIAPWCLPLLLHLFLYTVYTLCWHPHIGFTYTKRIHLVYLWYTCLHKKVHSVYMYTSGFIFLGCIHDHCTFILFQTTFSYCPSRLRMIAIW